LHLENIFSQLIEELGENPNREGLVKTPQRAGTTFKYLTQGYQQELEQVVGDGIFESDTDEMIIVKNIELYSMCEHHLMPFFGQCHVAYLPTGKILGFSKVARVVDLYARRLQIQEKLTKEIADGIMKVTNASGVGVIIEAKHLCMMMRGVEKQNSETTTSVMLGNFRKNAATRSEFLQLLR